MFGVKSKIGLLVFELDDVGKFTLPESMVVILPESMVVILTESKMVNLPEMCRCVVLPELS